MYETFARQGIKTVHYLPLAAAFGRYDGITVTEDERKKWGGRVSFVGGLYTDRGNFYDRIKDQLPDRTRGYLDGLIRSQLQIDGLNIIEQSIGGGVLDDMVEVLGLKPNYDGVESLEYLYSNYVINRKITALERSEIICMIGEKYRVNLYSNDDEFKSDGVNNRGSIDYYSEMPLVFKTSDINLNITLRSIQRGIPLRAMDILGCGGFLLTNYQEDMLQFFEPGRDFVYYESRQDLMDKVGYYLEHEDERRSIAENGLKKVQAEHTLEQRIEEILAIVEG
jgi:spore maturation protein CgeB